MAQRKNEWTPFNKPSCECDTVKMTTTTTKKQASMDFLGWHSILILWHIQNGTYPVKISLGEYLQTLSKLQAKYRAISVSFTLQFYLAGYLVGYCRAKKYIRFSGWCCCFFLLSFFCPGCMWQNENEMLVAGKYTHFRDSVYIVQAHCLTGFL